MINLKACTQECVDCIYAYKKKHASDFKERGGLPSFDIDCAGIPKEYADEELLQQFPKMDPEEIQELLDPVTWAAKNLDFHCLDPDGEVWKRKNPEEYYDWVKKHPGESIFGKSRYHRPYQAQMLRCKSRRKIFRAGRQIGKSMAIGVLILYHMVVKPGKAENDGFKIVLLAPYQSQIDVVFKIILDLLEQSPTLKNVIASNTKSPPRKLEFNNSSTIIGFTAGTKSGSGAASARGQAADMLLFDEGDYLAPADIDAAMSITTNYPNALVLMSSTPTGKRQKFYELAHSMGWKEFHFPSYVNPLWNKAFEKTMRETLTSLGWIFEIEAGWGERLQGVFQNQYVDHAKAEYDYGDIVKSKEWTYMMGVDWNDEATGTNIGIVGHNPANGKYYLVDKAVVQREGWTQLSACQKMVEMNRLWRCSAVYVDKGFGATSIEVLHQIGFEALTDPKRGPGHPDSIFRKVVAYDFGSKIETVDPWTKQKDRKDAKPFLVENAVRFFENLLVHYPASDKLLSDQLGGYIVERRTESGRPKYAAGEKGDHLLDAFMLALVAFALETTALGKPRFSRTVLFSDTNILPGRPDEEEKEIIPITETTVVEKVKKREKGLGSPGDRTEGINAVRPFSSNVNAPAHRTPLSAGPSRQNDGRGLRPSRRSGMMRKRENSSRTRGF